MDPTELQAWTGAIARGDTKAFRAFYEAWFDRLLAMAQSFTRRDESSCLDVVQDALLKIARSIHPFADEEDLSRWIFRVVQTAALDALRREARCKRREARAVAQRPANPNHRSSRERDPLELQEWKEWLRARLLALPATDRALLVERFENDSTLAQAGAAVGLSGDAAHGRIRRITRRLRALAEEFFHGTP